VTLLNLLARAVQIFLLISFVSQLDISIQYFQHESYDKSVWRYVRFFGYAMQNIWLLGIAVIIEFQIRAQKLK
jgi:hypothetical protein